MQVLGQGPLQAARPLGLRSWAEAKAFWFKVLGYRIQCDEVLAFHRSEARIRIPIAPARTSKSFSAAHDVIPYCMPTEPACDVLGWSIGPNFRVNKEFDYLWRVFVEEREKLALPNGATFEIERAVRNVSAGDLEIRFVKQVEGRRRFRTVIHGMSAENEKVLQGEQVTWAIQSEAAEHPAHILPKYLRARTWRILAPTTPKPKAEWLRELCEQGEANPGLGIESFTFPRWANPDYDEELFAQESAAAELRSKGRLGPHATAEDDPYFAEQFLGRWVYYTGRVLPFDPKRHVIDDDVWMRGLSKDRIRWGLGSDYGYEDPACAHLWAILPNGIYVIADEVYEKHLDTATFVEKGHALVTSRGVKPSVVAGDPSRPEVDRLMRDAGLDVFVMDKNAQRDRAAGHRKVSDLLVSGPVAGFPGLYVSRRCQKTIAEWKTLHYREGMTDEYSTNALVGADHAYDAARYFLMTRSEPVKQPKTEDIVTRWIRSRQRLRARRTWIQSRGVRVAG